MHSTLQAAAQTCTTAQCQQQHPALLLQEMTVTAASVHLVLWMKTQHPQVKQLRAAVKAAQMQMAAAALAALGSQQTARFWHCPC